MNCCSNCHQETHKLYTVCVALKWDHLCEACYMDYLTVAEEMGMKLIRDEIELN